MLRVSQLQETGISKRLFPKEWLNSISPSYLTFPFGIKVKERQRGATHIPVIKERLSL